MKLNTILFAAATWCCLLVAPAQASTVVCPGSLGVSVPGGGMATRQIQVTGALAGGECYFKSGNFQGDDVSAFLGSSYTMIEKDIAPNGGGAGQLLYTGSTFGTWTMGSNLWASYAEIFIGFHFGNGGGNPDSFLVELNPNTLNGTWSWVPTTTDQALSNIYLFGRNTRGGGDDETRVPEPGSLALVGLGLIGACIAFRRKPKV